MAAARRLILGASILFFFLGANQLAGKKITDIFVTGNQTVPVVTILTRIPVHIGDEFRPEKSRQVISSLFSLGMFNRVELTKKEDSQGVALTIKLQEKPKISEVIVTGNSQIGRDELNKKALDGDLTALDDGDVAVLTERIKKMYSEKDYHNAKISGKLETANDRTVAKFEIIEGSPTQVQQVFINGNRTVSSKILKPLLFTRESWLFGFFNKAGSFQPDALEYDKSVIENYYQNRGYLAASVTDVAVEPVKDSCYVNVTFTVDEGDLYTIDSVKAPGTSLMSEEELLAVIPIKPGQLYSREAVRETMELLRTLWGEYGYIYAEVEPSVVPDEANKTVALEFHSTLGSCMRLNRITIVGNKKTRDNVVRRNLAFEEGELLTTRKMDISKERVQALGFFDPRGGVNWKINRIDDEHADLELMLQEIKTGQFYLQMGTGGVMTDRSSPSESFRVSLGAQDTNVLGLGIQGSLNASYSRQDRSLDFSLVNPWLFDRPLYGGLQVFHRRSSYEEFHGGLQTPSELTTGGYGQLGFAIKPMVGTNAINEFGVEHIRFNHVVSRIPSLQPLFDRKFHSGHLVRLGLSVVQDQRNHPMMPSRGTIWSLNTRLGVPHGAANSFGFLKCEFDGQFYTPLINEYDLILRVHGFMGIIKQLGNHTIPYRDLFHIGGPATVRGFLYGQIGPKIVDTREEISDSLGAKKAMTINVELLFPVMKDGSIRGVFFYDGGAGWDTPDRNLITCGLRNNQFNFRHAIGFGIRLTKPSPVRIDVGFKLDRKKRWGETLSEVHFTMAQDF